METLVGFILSIIVVTVVTALLGLKTSHTIKRTKNEIVISNRKYAVRFLYSGLDCMLILVPFTIHNMWDKYTVRIYIVAILYSVVSIVTSTLYLKTKKDCDCKFFEYIGKFRVKNIVVRHSVFILLLICYSVYFVIN